jgi:hypothetical protein
MRLPGHPFPGRLAVLSADHVTDISTGNYGTSPQVTGHAATARTRRT